MASPSWSISRSLIRHLMEAAKHVYPDEFIALLSVSSSSPHTLSEFVVVPAEFGKEHSQLRVDLIPTDPLIVGTVHSHPSPSAQASDEDLNAFAHLGKIHLILAQPYGETNFRAYSGNGKRVTVPIV